MFQWLKNFIDRVHGRPTDEEALCYQMAADIVCTQYDYGRVTEDEPFTFRLSVPKGRCRSVFSKSIYISDKKQFIPANTFVIETWIFNQSTFWDEFFDGGMCVEVVIDPNQEGEKFT